MNNITKGRDVACSSMRIFHWAIDALKKERKKMKKIMKVISLFVTTVIVFMQFLSITPVAAETLRMLIWGEYATKEHQQIFIDLIKKKYHTELKLDITFAKSNDDFYAALRDQKVDILSPTHQIPKDMRFKLIKLNLLLPLNLNNIPNYKNIIPAFQRLDYCTENNQVYGVPVANVPYGLAYNTSIVSKEPDSWNIFWKPEYKGKYCISNTHYEPNIYVTALAMGIPRNQLGDYKTLNTQNFQKKLGQLVNHAKHFWGGIETAKDLKGLAIATAWGSALPQLKEMGEIWKMAEPKEGITTGIDHFMISHTLKKKPHLKRIAEEWLNYLLSDNSQLYMARVRGLPPTIFTVKNLFSPEEIKAFHLDDMQYYKNQRVLWPVLGKLDRKGLQRLWNKALKQRSH